ncbi:MAG: type II toxin-antitoxin system RelE/ParE family toxin [Bdellovibrionaceae bacterium]|nr:type II toxin-antitoxin system RelE/ParE family toxin [Pseudobdellovibrionaceae bacterium]
MLPNGKLPYLEWALTLPTASRARINSVIDRVALGGGRKNIKPVGEGVFEIKVNAGPGLRIYFAPSGKNDLLILLGGDKSSQKSDIRRAQKYWRGLMYRNKDFDEYVSQEMRDPLYRREYLISMISGDDGVEPLPLFDALKIAIGRMGVTEFAELVRMERSSVSRILSQSTIPKVETLDRFLKPFGLRVKLDVIEVA